MSKSVIRLNLKIHQTKDEIPLNGGKTVDVELGVIPAWRGDFEDVSVYSVPVFDTVNVLVAKTGKLKKSDDIKDFYGTMIGTNVGYYYTDGFSEAFESGKITREDSGEEGSSILKKLYVDRSDAVILDRYEARYWIKELGYGSENFEEVYKFKTDTPLQFRFHIDNKPIMEDFNKAITKMKQDGTIQKIAEKYTK